MKYKYDTEQVERDFKYYKDRDNSSDESIYFMLKERYYRRAKIAEERLMILLKQEVKGDNK